ncbi:hypothetical protein PLANPX_4354 [Lacipirellula parvula]|uniref:Uncharacterized protein n=1 Tax=Lacipirellula parvula TaxID=2650471 RepID=A0A5K7XFH0_9BACT|nr:hypothetical protein PLANPX_4354 [Lacipirellula parvula]
MDGFPPALLAAFSVSEGEAIRSWWATLGDVDRDRIIELWDERLEVCFFAPQADEAGRADEWSQLPEVEGGRFVPHDDSGAREWGPGYFEYLLQHPEFVITYEPELHKLYPTCTQHAVARACVTSGSVPVQFSCPVNMHDCPLLRLRGGRLTRAKVN